MLTLALKMNLTPALATILPTVITVASRKAGLTEANLIAEALVNEPLRTYLKEVCVTSAAKV